MADRAVLGAPYRASLTLALTLFDNWGEIDGKMLLQTGRGLDDMGLRQGLNIAYSWLISRRPSEVKASVEVTQALNNEFSVSENASVMDLSKEQLESMLDAM